MNIHPECRSKPHNLLLVALTDGKPKDFDVMLSSFSELSDFVVNGQWWRPIVSFVSGDLPALADCAGVQGHACFFGCVRCHMSATRVTGGLYYLAQVPAEISARDLRALRGLDGIQLLQWTLVGTDDDFGRARLAAWIFNI